MCYFNRIRDKNKKDRIIIMSRSSPVVCSPEQASKQVFLFVQKKFRNTTTLEIKPFYESRAKARVWIMDHLNGEMFHTCKFNSKNPFPTSTHLLAPKIVIFIICFLVNILFNSKMPSILFAIYLFPQFLSHLHTWICMCV